LFVPEKPDASAWFPLFKRSRKNTILDDIKTYLDEHYSQENQPNP